MRKILRQQFMDKISEVAFMIEKEKDNIKNSLFKTHPAAPFLFDSLESLSFHEPTEDIFQKLLNSAENSILAFYLLAKETPLKRTIDIPFYQQVLNKNKDEFMKLADSDKLNKELIEKFLLNSFQPEVYTLLYITFPQVAENEWDKSIAFIIFLRVKSFLDCLNMAY